MNLYKFSPAILTLIIFVLAQAIGTALILSVGIESVSLFSAILMGVNVFAVLGCYFLLHNIRFSTLGDVFPIRWYPAMLAFSGGCLGALSISILTDTVELPAEVLKVSLAMSQNFWGLLALIVVGPICEEILFREAIVGEMLRRGACPWMAIIVSALAFSLTHLNLAQGLYAFPLGLMFGIIYYKTGNILLTSLLHILNNDLAAAQLNAMGEKAAEVSFAEWFGSATTAYTVMAVTGILCIILMKKLWDC